MKNRAYILLSILMAACSQAESVDPTAERGEGRMTIGFDPREMVEISTSTRATEESEELDIYEIPAKLIPTAEEMQLTISGTYYPEDSDTLAEFYEEYESIAAYNTMESDESDPSIKTPPYLPAGDYTATISNGKNPLYESETNASFSGSAEFTIYARDNNGKCKIEATLQNSIIRMTRTTLFDKYFAGGSTLTLSTEQGTELTVTTPSESTEEQILFVEPGTNIYFEGTAIKQDPGNGFPPTVTFAKDMIGETTLAQMTTVIADIENVGGGPIYLYFDGTIAKSYDNTVDLNEGEDIVTDPEDNKETEN